MTAPTPPMIAQLTDLKSGSLSSIARSINDDNYLTTVLQRAARKIESRCTRRFAPFTTTETWVAEGVDLNYLGGMESGLPVSMVGSLAMSKSASMGAPPLVRDVWLDQYAPMYPELWTYSNVSVTLTRAWGDSETLQQSAFEGPRVDSGYLRLPVGTLCPPGTVVSTTYSGGYTVTFPQDLIDATKFEAVKALILEIEPQARQGMDTADLDGEIAGLLIPYMRE